MLIVLSEVESFPEPVKCLLEAELDVFCLVQGAHGMFGQDEAKEYPAFVV